MFGNLFEKNVTRADVNKFERDIEKGYRDLSVTFKDTRTGELHVVAYEDDAKFYELVKDKNMKIVFS